MKRNFAVFLTGFALLLLCAAGLLYGQQSKVVHKGKGGSPHEEVSWTLKGKKLTITYGRPFKKGRKVFGGLEQYGKVWRTGADEATTLATEGDLMVGSIHVPAGTYSLFTIPNEKEWTLILNKTANQWGAFKYDQGTDLGRTSMKVAKASSPVEQLTIEVAKQGDDRGTLRIMWDDTVASVSLMAH